MTSRRHLELDLVIVVCAVSAGIHAALTPDHFAEGTASGAGFLAAAVALAGLAALLTVRPENGIALTGAAVVLGGLIGAYGLAITTGLPLVQPEREQVDALAVFTKAVEGAGLLAAMHFVRRPRLAPLLTLRPKGTLT